MVPGVGDIRKYLFGEWRLIRRVPVSFATAVLVAGGVIWLAMEWRYGGIIENLKAENGRLHVALGVEPATPSALISLNNVELKAKARTVASAMKEIYKEYQDGCAGIEKQAKLTDAQKFAQEQSLAKDLYEQYDRETRSDAYNVDFELRRRLGPKAVTGIVGIMPSLVGRDGSRINILQVTQGSPMPIVDMSFLGTLAFGIQQMAKLLPDKG